MFSTKFVSAAIATGALAVCGAAGAATVTLNPQAANGGLGVVDAGTAAFNTTGGTLSLGTSANPNVLTINGTTGVQTWTETGTIYIQPTLAQNALYGFTNGSSSSPVGLGGYSIYATYSLAGGGAWGTGAFATSFGADPTSIVMNMTMFAVTASGPTITLGTAFLRQDPTNLATVALNTGNGSANSVLSAVLGFTPAAGTTGAGGFFQAPSPFNININVGSIGGNSGNTTYSIVGGKVVVTTPIAGQSPSTGNFTFTSVVPEPGALSLAGLALVGAAVASRRKAKAAA
ncbi:MAG: PEP-CTERM sorting domain-containing protein [Burkholderiales bacterium]|nr:PEP-CTERM sorting domain-containing protein [Burkholderiales bacterium]